MLDTVREVIVTTIDHDPNGTHAKHFLNVNETLDSLYTKKLISFTDVTNQTTINAAQDLGWEVAVGKYSTNPARFRAVERALNQSGQFINLWDADRLIYAATVSPTELRDLITETVKYDFLIVGATPDAIKTHQSSMTVWESIKSWRVGKYLGIEGDITNRGCFVMSRELATFVTAYKLEDHDETDSLFPMLALAYQKSLRDSNQFQLSRGIGYKEYEKIVSYEDWLFDGLSPEESARRKNTVEDFERRETHVKRILDTAQKISSMYGLTS